MYTSMYRQTKQEESFHPSSGIECFSSLHFALHLLVAVGLTETLLGISHHRLRVTRVATLYILKFLV